MADEGLDVSVGPCGEVTKKTHNVHVHLLAGPESYLPRRRGYPPRRILFPLLERSPLLDMFHLIIFRIRHIIFRIRLIRLHALVRYSVDTLFYIIDSEYPV